MFEKAIEIAPFGPEEIRINLISTHLANFDFDKASQIATLLLNQGDKRSIFIGSMFLIYIKAKTGEIEDEKRMRIQKLFWTNTIIQKRKHYIKLEDIVPGHGHGLVQSLNLLWKISRR